MTLERLSVGHKDILPSNHGKCSAVDAMVPFILPDILSSALAGHLFLRRYLPPSVSEFRECDCGADCRCTPVSTPHRALIFRAAWIPFYDSFGGTGGLSEIATRFGLPIILLFLIENKNIVRMYKLN